MRNFRELKIWNNGMEIVKDTYLLAKELPNLEKFGLVSQVTRAAVLIPSNIAEASSRSSDKEFRRFLEVSLGSLFELETQLLIIKDLRWVDAEKLSATLSKIEETEKMLSTFISKVRARNLKT